MNFKALLAAFAVMAPLLSTAQDIEGNSLSRATDGDHRDLLLTLKRVVIDKLAEPKRYPIGECQGHCRGNGQCKGKHMKCYLKEGLVPGCRGLPEEGVRYCYDVRKAETSISEIITTAPKSIPPATSKGVFRARLKYVGKFRRRKEKYPLGRCKGHCFGDRHCKAGFKCHKVPGEIPYGCKGRAKKRVQYCYKPPRSPPPPETDAPLTRDTTSSPTSSPTISPTTQAPTQSPTTSSPTMSPTLAPTNPPTPTPLPLLREVADDLTTVLGECEGDCDSNKQCAGRLMCMKREAFEDVPGCSTEYKGEATTDYCYDPQKVVVERTPPQLGTDGKILYQDVTEDTPTSPLGKCQGDCDADIECEGRLRCQKRNAWEQVPGCSTDTPGQFKQDYCYDPSDL